MRGKALLFVPALLALGLACTRDSQPKPEPIYLGEDVCQRCRMIISDERFAAELVYGGGRAEKFDDVGCMIHSLRELKEGKGAGVPAVFVKDYYTREWVEGRKAYFVGSAHLRTPMGHGVAALSSKESAGRLRGELPEGKVMDFEGALDWLGESGAPEPHEGEGAKAGDG